MTNTLNYEAHGCRKRVAVISRNSERLILDFSGFDAYEYRTENKRTGKPLAHPVRELKQANKMWIDGSRYYMADWESDKNIHIYEDCSGFHGRMYLKENYYYTDDEMLKAVEDITGVKYDRLEEVSRINKPAEWETLKEQETREETEEAIERRARDIAEKIETAQGLKCFEKYFNIIIKPDIEKLETSSGTTPADVARIKRQLKTCGSFRENNYFYSDFRAIVKLPRNDLFRVYNLKPDSHNVIHYFEITKDGRITG